MTELPGQTRGSAFSASPQVISGVGVHKRQPMTDQDRSHAASKGLVLRIWQRLIEGLGWACIVLGIAGALLPVLPAWPFLLPGIILLGPRNRGLRIMAARLRMMLRQGSRSPNTTLRVISQALVFQERAIRVTLRPLIVAWMNPNGIGGSPLRYLVMLLPPLAIGFTIFLVVQLLALI